ncbi:hypothetical protein GCM10023188_12770 [Pontibacter saemangeumensis]|uniref:Por secretion system C-terminal sorting domain-containing protein n=1 Tax=Pontibacter saemangeumensis TaxID=1084525 RepID=A0ABP8LHL6_9BACT
MRTMKAAMLILLAICFSCQDESNPNFPDIKVAMNDISGVAISDSVYYIIADTLPNIVTAVSEVSDADMFYSVNNAAFTMRINEPIPLQKQDTVLQFHLTKKGYNESGLKTVILQAHSEKFLEKVNVSSPVSDSSLTISMDDKSRGMMQIEIFSTTGKRLLRRNHLKNVDSFIINYALPEYPKGIYMVFAAYGKDKKVYKFIKE